MNYETLNGFAYTAQALVAGVLNTMVIATVFSSQRMRITPKYWLVLIVSATYLIQVVFANPQMVVVWFLGNHNHYCTLWTIAVAYNTYVCVGITCWCSLLMNMDYFLCVLSTNYRHRQRAPVIMCMSFVCIVTLIASLLAITIVFGSTMKPYTGMACYYGITNILVGEALLEYTVYFPLQASIVFIVLAVCFRKRGTNIDLLRSDQLNLTASRNVTALGYSGTSRFPPLDHALFLLILILFYLPATVMSQLAASKRLSPQEYKDNMAYVYASTVAAVMRDNVGCFAALTWYCFTDMRYTLMQFPCFKRKPQPSDSAFVESSEFRVYDAYPYCANRDGC